jgi:hypothetical protein
MNRSEKLFDRFKLGELPARFVARIREHNQPRNPADESDAMRCRPPDLF